MKAVQHADAQSNPQRGDDRAQTISWPALGLVAAVTAGVLCWHVWVLPIGDSHYGLFANYADLTIYRAGGHAVAHGVALYDGPVIWNMQFTYTPFAGLLFVPWAWMTPDLAHTAWWGATFVSLIAVVVLSFRSLGYPFTRRLFALGVGVAVVVSAFEPVRTTIWLGQINIFLLLLIVADLARPAGGRWRGVGAGIAAGIKLTPALFLVYLAITRQWRAGGLGIGALGATIAVGFAVIPADSWRYWTASFSNADRVGGVDGPGNQSLNGFAAQMLKFYDVTRYQDPQTHVFEPPTWMWLLLAVPALVLGLAAGAAAHRRGQELLALTLTGMTATAVSPFSWGHHWVWFVPLFVLALHHAMAGITRRRWLLPAVVFFAGFCWWWNYWDIGPWRSADHLIGIGLFMLPRDGGHWWQHITVPIYAGFYLLVFTVTAMAALWPSTDK